MRAPVLPGKACKLSSQLIAQHSQVGKPVRRRSRRTRAATRCRLSDGTVTAPLLHHLAELRTRCSGGSSSAEIVPAPCACWNAWNSCRCSLGSSVRRACVLTSAARSALNRGSSVRPRMASPLRRACAVG